MAAMGGFGRSQADEMTKETDRSQICYAWLVDITSTNPRWPAAVTGLYLSSSMWEYADGQRKPDTLAHH